MRKREFIELCQATIEGGNVPPDLTKKAHPAVIGGHINNAISEIINGPRKDLAGELSIPYDNLSVTQTASGKWVVVLPVRPMAADDSIVSVKDDVGRFVTVRRTMENLNLDFISPIQHNLNVTVQGAKLIFPSEPKRPNGTTVETVNTNIIADFNSLSDNDYVVVAGAENVIVKEVVRIMSMGTSVMQDQFNNARVDREAGA
jgi:hypothetical protein